MYVLGKEDPILNFALTIDDDDDKTKLEKYLQAAIFSTAPNHVEI